MRLIFVSLPAIERVIHLPLSINIHVPKWAPQANGKIQNARRGTFSPLDPFATEALNHIETHPS